MRMLSQNMFDNKYALLFRFMSEHRPPDNISNTVDASYVSLQMVINNNSPLLVYLDSDFIQAQVFRMGLSPSSDKNVISSESYLVSSLDWLERNLAIRTVVSTAQNFMRS